MKTVVGLFDTTASAEKAMRDLEAIGIAHSDISIAANNDSGQYPVRDSVTTTTDAANSASETNKGAVEGGVAGLVIGLAALAVPGLGWFAIAGWLGTAVVGAAVGAAVGLTGALMGVGVPHEEAELYNEGVRRGGTLLAVKAPDEQAQRVSEILADDGAADIDERADLYRQSGFVPQVVTTTDAAAAPVPASGYSPSRIYGDTAVNSPLANAEHTARDAKDDLSGAAYRTESKIENAVGANGLPGVQTGGRDVDGSPDTRGITEKVADAVTGDRVDDKTGKAVA